MRNRTPILIFLLLFKLSAFSQVLNLPPRPAGALTGDAFVTLVTSMSLTDRENEIFNQVMSGNVPDFQRTLIPVNGVKTINSTTYNYTYYVIPDYLAIGCDTNYFLCPMTPLLAQRICDITSYTMPTRKMVNEIWTAAPLHLPPTTISPSPQMTTIPVMDQHNSDVWAQRQPLLGTYPLGTLTGGDKKDVVISNIIYGYPAPGRVVIYGWHYTSGTPIQPLYNGHEETYADYSHGIRLVQNAMIINGNNTSVSAILQDANLYSLLSDEGVIAVPRYPVNLPAVSVPLSFAALSEDSDAISISVSPQTDVTHYMVQTGSDGLSFPQTMVLHKDSLLIQGLPQDDLIFLRIAAMSSYDTSAYSEVLAVATSACAPRVIIVNGFDRASTGNTYNFIRQHGMAFHKQGYAFSSATNEAILNGLVSLNDFRIADYILGNESSVNETFSTAEQSVVMDFLEQGGCFFVSGAEIAWDLDHLGSTTDKSFFHNYLKSSYVLDAPNDQSGVYYQCEPSDTSIFAGLGVFSFDNGTHGTYNVNYPDVLGKSAAASYCLKYSGLNANYAGVVYQGLFPGGTLPGSLVNIGVPFETFYPENVRDSLMKRILTFFGVPAIPAIPQLSVSGDTLFSSALFNQWLFNGNVIAGETGNYMVMLWSGHYSAIAVEGDCLSDTSANFPYIVTGIQPLKVEDRGVRVFPNPAKESIYVECSAALPADCLLQMYNADGQLVLETVLAGSRSIDMNALKRGLYVIRIQGEGLLVTQRILLR